MPSDVRPNLLVIMTDQQSATMLSCAGNADVHTPNLDALAARGVRFERAYCTQPICVPSRTSLWTGRMPHETGVIYNLDRHEVMVPCVGRHLADAGYDCHYVGKWHVPMEERSTAWHGFATMSHAHGHHTDAHVSPACDTLFAQQRDKPFFIVASFHNPHDICQWARGDALPNGDLPPPEASDVDWLPALPANHLPPEGEPDVIRELQRSHWRTYPTTDFTELDWRRYRWAYARLVEKVDAQVGQVLASLDAHGLRDNTTIVFLSDHGDGNAAHRWNQKSLFYDEIARVPFVIVPPGAANPRVDQTNLISTGLDLVPTLCAYAGVAPPAGCLGQNLRPVVEQGATLPRDYVVSETTLAPEYGVDSGVYGRMLRTARHKYVAFSRGRKREQLFDPDHDPGEMQDLSEQPQHAAALTALRDELAEWCRRTSDPFDVPSTDRDGWRLQPG